jgi:aspartate 1-decarboxylase
VWSLCYTPMMHVCVLKTKIHRATVTQSDLHYEGSLTVDSALLEAANLLPYEAVHVWNVNSGQRFETYAMAGERGSGIMCVNGAAARLAQPGDLIIVAAFCWVDEETARQWTPRIVFVDERNRPR